MTWHPLVPFAPMLALLAWAAVDDVRRRVIRNWLTFSLVLGGLLQSLGPAGTVSPAQSLLGVLVAVGLLVVPFALGAVGGGDVKMLAGIAAWVGPGPAVAIFALEKVIGLGIVLAQAGAAGRLRELFRNSAVLAVDLAHLRSVGVEQARADGRAFRSIDRPLPYAVPTLLATAVLLLARAAGGLR